MSCKCHSDNFSTSFRSCLPTVGSSCCSSCSNNLAYTTTSCSPSTCQLRSSLNNGCQETCIEPTSCQRSCVVSSPSQKPCYYPRSYTPCSPCQGTYAGSLGVGSSSCCSLDYGSRRCYIMGCGSNGFESLNYGVSGFPLLSYGYRFCYPTDPAASIYQPYYKPTCGNIFYGFNC
ncbi:keratin-associated protein 13-1-like [Grammomys surdaster]|uniref:keratin-associated protein 13-1-like n=1 Tax=Grammomys surdaster TaxID=491861 RepID=UPI00109FCE78|nr:keratin-associated protein 13-1-like [Grammomys surdaster]